MVIFRKIIVDFFLIFFLLGISFKEIIGYEDYFLLGKYDWKLGVNWWIVVGYKNSNVMIDRGVVWSSVWFFMMKVIGGGWYYRCNKMID